jgi:hypothetical protein
VTHDAGVEGVQLHPLLAVTANDPVAPSGPTDTSVGAREYEHCRPAWLRTSERPAIVSVASRPRLSAFDATATLTVPGPEPVPPDGNVAHAAGLDELHGQPPCVVTVTGTVVASAPTFTRLGEMLKVQLPPACVTLIVCPATVSVPDRSAPVVFAETLNVALPLPGPPPLASVIHGAELDALQAQLPPVVTLIGRLDAADERTAVVGDTLKVQTTPACVTVNVWPAIVTVPVRAVVLGFAATL